MIHVAIVEDESKAREALKACLAYVAEKNQTEIQITEFVSGTAFLGGYQPIYDIVLMDIEMPGMNGMETAKALRKMDAAVILIFVTNLTQYAIMGYEVDALSYILKPVNRFDFALKMSKAIARTAKRGEESVVIKTARETHSVRIAAIQYVEADGHNMVYHTTEGVFSEYGTLKDTEKKLNKNYFVRCNRCFLVNLRFVASVKEDTVFIGQDALQISRSQKKAFLNALTVYIGGVKG